MILSDKSIKERLKKESIIIDPLHEENIQPSSVDVHLASRFLVFKNHQFGVYDVKEKMDNSELIDVGEGGSFIIHPNEFCLGNTTEFVRVPNDLVCVLNGRSSIGRLGLIVHATAGYVDPGFEGHITLEMLNMSGIALKIYAGMRIAQISFFQLSTPADTPYGSTKGRNKYKGQVDPTASQIWKDFSGK